MSAALRYERYKAEIKEIWWLSVQFSVLWFLSNYFYNSGLASTSVSSSTVLSDTSSIFVYIVGLCLLPGAVFEPVKAISVLGSFAGIVIITLADRQDPGSDSQSETFKGDVLSLLSAVFYGFYAVTLKKRVPEEQEAEFKFSYFLGFVGLLNAICLLPLFPILDATGVEKFEWPNRLTLGALLLNALMGTVISDYCWAKSVVLLGPLATSLGLALTIPISMIVDGLRGLKTFTWVYFLGSALILGGFFANSYFDHRKARKARENSDFSAAADTEQEL